MDYSTPNALTQLNTTFTSFPHRITRSLLLLGAPLVGKTALCHRLVSDHFDDAYEPTYENTFTKIITQSGREREVECILKDSAGLTGEDMVRSEYALGYHGYIFVYSISSIRSFESVKMLHEQLVTLLGTASIPMILVGNKSDVSNEGARIVTYNMGKALADEWKCPFVECSAKTNYHIEKVFLSILDEIDRCADGDTTQHSFMASFLLSIVSSACCCRPFRDDLINEGSKWERVLFVLMTVTLLIGAAAFSYGTWSGLTAKSNETGLFAYIIFSIGILNTAVTMIGCFGLRQSRIEHLRVFVITLSAIILVQIGAYILLIVITDLFAEIILQSAIGLTVTVGIQAVTVGLAYFYMKLLNYNANSAYSSTSYSQFD
jgi:small GTP-binding protein